LISIVIINFNGERFINNCLNSILASHYRNFEVFIVDNNSTDQSREILQNYQSHPKIKLIYLRQNIGPAYARNLAAQKAQGGYLVFLDYDTIVDKDWLIKAISYLEQNPNIGAGQLKILKMGTNIYDCAGEKLTPFGFLAERARSASDRGQFNKVTDIFSGKTAAMIVKKSVFEEVDGFDKDFFIYWEEPDLCWRVWKTGLRVVFLPMGKVWHAYGTKEKPVSAKQATLITRQGCRNQIMTIIKNGVGFSGLRMLISAILAWFGLMILFIIKLDFAKATAVGKAFFWLLKRPKFLWQKRKTVKKRLGERFGSDAEWLPKVSVQQGIKWYLGKGISFVLGQPY